MKNNRLFFEEMRKKIDKALKSLNKENLPDKNELKNLLKNIIAHQIEPAHKNETLFRTTLYSIGDAVITTDKMGRIQNMNRVAEKLTGWREKEAKNKSLETVFRIVNEESGKTVQNSANRVLRTGKIVGLASHTLLISKSGKKIPIADSSAPIKNERNEIVGVVLVFRDQTQEREQQKILEDRERKFATLVSNLPGFVYRCANDANWTMEFISEGCREITGYAPVDFINNKKIAFNDIIHKDYQKTIWSSWQKILKRKGFFEFEYPIITKNKKLKWVWERGRGVYSGNGKLLFLEGFITDITRLKEAEDSITMFKFATDQSPDAVFWMKYDGGFYYVNDQACRSLGYTKDELLKLKLFDIDPHYPKANWNKAWKKFRNNKITSEKIETYHKRNDGTIFPVEVTAMHCWFANEDLHIAFARDISDRKKAEEKLKEGESWFKTLFDDSPDTILLADPETGIILDTNYAATRVTGYKKNELVGKHFLELHPKRLKDYVKKGFEIHSKSDPNIQIENLLLCKDGKEIPMEVMANIFEVNGKRILQGVFRDITKRKQTEEKLRNSEISFRNIFNSVTEAIYIQSKDGLFIDVNDGAVNMYGYSKEELIGKNPGFVSAPDKNDIPKVTRMVEKAFDGKKQQFEFWGKRKNGEIFLKDVHLYPGKFFNEDVVIAVARDITKQREAETALKISEERYKLIAENTIDSIAVFDLNLNYTYLSPAVYKLLGYTPDELMEAGLFSVLTTESIIKVQKIYQEEIEIESLTEKDLNRSRVIDLEQVCKNGKHIWVESTLSFIRDKNLNAISILAVSRDITEKKMVEKALAESEERYRIISSLTSDYLFSTSLDENDSHSLVWVAGSFEKITGYTMDEYISKGGWVACLHPDDMEKDVQDMNMLRMNQKVVSEIRTIHKNGEIVWVRSYAYPVWDYKKNKLKGIYGAVEDITQRKQNEMLQHIQYKIADAVVTSKSLNELFILVRNELSETINVNNFFIALYDEKTGMLRSDIDKDEVEEISEWPAQGSMTGYVIESAKSQLLKRSDINKLISEGKAGMIGVIPEIWLGVPFKVAGKIIGVLVVQSYDDENAYTKSSVEILEIVAHELSIFIQHKKAEEETIKLSTAIIQSPTSIEITDISGNIEFVNPKFTKISGYTLEEAQGKNPRFLKSGEHGREFYEDLWKTILSGKVWQSEIRNKKKNGELYWENVIISPIINDDNIITHFVAVKEDISEKKNMIRELIAAKEKAEEMNLVKSSFFANMSHELRTPMVGILGFSEVLLNELQGSPELLHMIKSINTSGRRLLETLNMILNISKLEAAKFEFDLEPFNIIELLQEIFDNFSSAAANKTLNYMFIHDKEKILCDIDENIFNSIFNNLINNAIKFTDRGSIQLVVRQINDNVVIEVIDSGVGISSDKLNIIWEEFRQASEGYNRSFEGTGLGLSIARRYVELLKGSISVSSMSGVGTTFTVILPLSETNVDSGESYGQNEPVSYHSHDPEVKKKKFLYVEDDEVSVIYVQMVTKDLYIIDSAKDSDEALAMISKEKYDAILMDINLKKGMDGIELTKLIRRHPEYKNTPVIALTAFAMGHEKEEFLSKGMTHYLSKPFVKQQLLDVLKNACEVHNS